jgi:hypothetical protein
MVTSLKCETSVLKIALIGLGFALLEPVYAFTSDVK